MSEAGSSNAFDCAFLPEIVIVAIIVMVILSMLTLLVSIISLYEMVKSHKKVQKYSIWNSKSIYVTQWIFYIICAIISICRVPDIIACNYFPTQSVFHDWTLSIISFGYIYHWIAFVSLFYFRLKRVFKDTKYQISKCYNCISIFIICLLSIIFPLIIIADGIMFGGRSDFGVILAIFLYFISMVFSQTLGFTLIYKLYKLNKLNNANNANDRIITTITKYTLLTLVSMTGTIVYIIILILGINQSYHSSMKYLVNITSNQLDVFIDTVSVSLTLKVYDKYYKMLCIKCDSKCKECCLSLTNNSTMNETNLAEEMSNIASTSSAVNSTVTVSRDNN